MRSDALPVFDIYEACDGPDLGNRTVDIEALAAGGSRTIAIHRRNRAATFLAHS
jgi:hypothetical protein